MPQPHESNWVRCDAPECVFVSPHWHNEDEETRFSAPQLICAEVTWDMRDENCGDHVWWDTKVGDLLWNPKMPEGHVLVAEVRCGEKYNGRTVDCSCGGWGSQPCPSVTLICECGQDGSRRDHHYVVLAKPGSGAFRERRSDR